MTHRREQHRPSSTGNLIKRLFPDARQHIWQPEHALSRESLILPGRTAWILHPAGEEAPGAVDPAGLQLLLLDGSWPESATMVRALGDAGSLVRLPLHGSSRFWLRAQHNSDRFSTAEALLFLLQHLGLHEAHTMLQNQFELHVYASLRARGRVDLAADFLAGSTLPQAFPDFLAALQARRPLPG